MNKRGFWIALVSGVLAPLYWAYLTLVIYQFVSPQSVSEVIFENNTRDISMGAVLNIIRNVMPTPFGSLSLFLIASIVVGVAEGVFVAMENLLMPMRALLLYSSGLFASLIAVALGKGPAVIVWHGYARNLGFLVFLISALAAAIFAYLQASSSPNGQLKGDVPKDGTRLS